MTIPSPILRPQLRFFFPCALARFPGPFPPFPDEAVRARVPAAVREGATVRALPPPLRVRGALLPVDEALAAERPFAPFRVAACPWDEGEVLPPAEVIPRSMALRR